MRSLWSKVVDFARRHPRIMSTAAIMATATAVVAAGVLLGAPLVVAAVVAGSVSAVAGYVVSAGLRREPVSGFDCLLAAVVGGVIALPLGVTGLLLEGAEAPVIAGVMNTSGALGGVAFNEVSEGAHRDASEVTAIAKAADARDRAAYEQWEPDAARGAAAGITAPIAAPGAPSSTPGMVGAFGDEK